MSAKSKIQSFYFFDLDDNAFFLDTPVFIKNLKTGDVKSVSTHKFAEMRGMLGNTDPWTDYALFDGSYKNFRDRGQRGKKEYLVEDIENSIKKPDSEWQGPAFKMLQYACAKGRPIGIVTARGHSRATIKKGLKVLVDHKYLESPPKFLNIYAVSNDSMRNELLNSVTDPAEREAIENDPDPTSPLKRIAIRKLVEAGLNKYGKKPEHNFGMSDDDPRNVDLIIKAMCDCKKKYKDKRFFVINTHKGEHVKLEVFPMDFPVTKRPEADEIFG